MPGIGDYFHTSGQIRGLWPSRGLSKHIEGKCGSVVGLSEVLSGSFLCGRCWASSPLLSATTNWVGMVPHLIE